MSQSIEGATRDVPALAPLRTIRSIFRTVELLDGWSGKLATDQVLFTVLDGGMIILSSLLLNVLHPMRAFFDVAIRGRQESGRSK